MRVRDRLILAVVGAIIVVVAVWLVLVSPERSKVSSLDTQITAARSQLQSAQASLAAARVTAQGYPQDVAAISHVMTAVPPDPQEANIVTTITQLAGTSVDVHEIAVGAGGGSTGGVGTGLTFTFKSTYGQLETLIAKLDNLLKTDGTNIEADGRAFTINSVALTPIDATRATATVTVVAYSQNATTPTSSTATPTGSTGATGSTTSTP